MVTFEVRIDNERRYYAKVFWGPGPLKFEVTVSRWRQSAFGDNENAEISWPSLGGTDVELTEEFIQALQTACVLAKAANA